jgi:uncharacterized protein (DUF4415 family)
MSKLPPPADFDESPEWTEADFARARPASEVHGKAFAAGLVRPRGRPALAEADRKAKVNIRLSPDVVAALRATGAGWQTRADQALRKAFVKQG